METSALSALSSAGKAQNSRNSIADNFDTFLTLLTTQLQNQNPLEPLDTNQFTAQLVQFANVEQSIQTTDNLESLLALTGASTLTNAVSFLGKTITAEGVSTELSGGKATWNYTAAADSPDATVTITDSGGQIVFSEKVALEAGNHRYVWNGRDAGGRPLADGLYRIAIDAKDANGGRVNVTTSLSGVVEGVDLTGDEPVLTVNGTQVRFSAVRTVEDSA